MRKLRLLLLCLCALILEALAFSFFIPVKVGGEEILIGNFVLGKLSLSQFSGNIYVQSILVALAWIFTFLFGYFLNERTKYVKSKKSRSTKKLLKKIELAKMKDKPNTAIPVQAVSVVERSNIPTKNQMSSPSKFKRLLPKDNK